MAVTALNTKGRVLLTVNDLAEQLGISASAIYRRRSLGEPLPPTVRIGSTLRWRQRDVDEWLEAHLEVA